jgi:hypothetical protein
MKSKMVTRVENGEKIIRRREKKERNADERQGGECSYVDVDLIPVTFLWEREKKQEKFGNKGEREGEVNRAHDLRPRKRKKKKKKKKGGPTKFDGYGLWVDG